MVLILKFLMKDLFAAINGSLISAPNTASAVFGRMGSMPTDNEIMNLVPR